MVLPFKSMDYGTNATSGSDVNELDDLKDVNKPMDLPIMPIAGFYDQDMVNVLGNLK